MDMTRTATAAAATLVFGTALALGTAAPAFAEDPVPPTGPDVDCPDVTERNFEVSPGDPHNFDADEDGIGCEEGDDMGGESDDTEDDGTEETSDDTADETADDASEEPDDTTGEEPSGDEETPVGGVDTGAGGTADGGSDFWLITAGGVLVAAAVGGIVVARRPGNEG